MQSSLFVQAIAIGGTIGCGFGRSITGSGVFVVGISASGGRGVVVVPASGISGSICTTGISAIGEMVISGFCVAIALQCTVGLPVVPGGHTQDGRCPTV